MINLLLPVLPPRRIHASNTVNKLGHKSLKCEKICRVACTDTLRRQLPAINEFSAKVHRSCLGDTDELEIKLEADKFASEYKVIQC